MFSDAESFDVRAWLPMLRVLSRRFPTASSARAEIGHLRAVLTLPKGTVHVVSDVHGEHKKLKHIVNNASGSLRPIVESIFEKRAAGQGEPTERDLLALIYYPRETYARLRPLDDSARARFVLAIVERVVEVVKALSRRHARRHVDKTYPTAFATTIRELVASREIEDGRDAFHAALLDPFLRADREIDLLRALAHVVRHLSVEELVVAGDLGDRGPRLDRVVDFLMRQRKVTLVWGNHDASWMGACLGHEALVATVVRISIRYGRLEQLEEGYGISLAPLEHLARVAYADDPAERFLPKSGTTTGAPRDPLLLARMQKAASVLQFKLEAALARRHPSWGLDGRRLLERLDLAQGTVEIDGVSHALADRLMPTVDPRDPTALTADEATCLALLRGSFLASPTLWRHMSWVEQQGKMSLVRDRAVIFHGCVPVDADGRFLEVEVDGAPRSGRALFDAAERVVRRAFRARGEDDLDFLYFLWAGARSPLFGKDRMATFESAFVSDPSTHKETKNPYFALLADAGFCAEVCREFGADPARGLIVNGHVPVHIERGESPLKKSGRAVTIDGAFSEAYGDHGYTLVLDASCVRLAQHHHFESVEDAVDNGADIIPTIAELERYERPRTIADTEEGAALENEIRALEALVSAYESRLLPELAD